MAITDVYKEDEPM